MRERSVLFKEVVDCCDYTSSTVEEEMGSEQCSEAFRGKPKQ
jgi:hypothetical protein